MTKSVKKLSDQVINRIAAGEVIERPASVVKELVENSIDADSKNIEITLLKSGKQQIAINDDGIGMDEDDAVLSFERHSTSKISSDKDLESIVSFGFRGEAIASIASVSYMRMRTQPRGYPVGIEIINNAGIIEKISKISKESGTYISVENLFFNVPARKKFLKTDKTEYNRILESLTDIALANHDIGFKFANNQRDVFHYPGVNHIKNRVIQVYGNEIYNDLVYFENETNQMKVYGFVSAPEHLMHTKPKQRFFVNDRPVQDKILYSAVMKGFGTLLPKNLFPRVILFLNINPELVDVNVHPAKREVRFQEEGKVYYSVYQAIQHGLSTNEIIPSLDSNRFSPGTSKPSVPSYGKDFKEKKISRETEKSIISSIYEAGKQRVKENHQQNRASENLSGSTKTEKVESCGYDLSIQNDKKTMNTKGSAASDMSSELSLQNAESSKEAPKKIVGENQILEFSDIFQIHNTYIIAQIKDGMIIADQHAVHERILYEKILNKMESSRNISVNLLSPITVELPAEYFSFTEEKMEELKKIGFDLKIFGENTIVIDGIPGGMKINLSSGKFFIDFISELYEKGKFSYQDLAAVYACKAAVKAGDSMENLEMQKLLEDLFKSENPYTCPHGRPTVIQMSLYDLEKQFKRKL